MPTPQQLGPIARRSIPDAIKHQFLVSSGSPRDCTGYDIVAFVKPPGQSGWHNRPAEWIDAATGICRYVFIEGDLAIQDATVAGQKVGTAVQFVAEHPQTGRRHISDPAYISVVETPVSARYDE